MLIQNYTNSCHCHFNPLQLEFRAVSKVLFVLIGIKRLIVSQKILYRCIVSEQIIDTYRDIDISNQP